MKQREFLRWLKAQGVETKEGTNHIKLYLNGKQSVLPDIPRRKSPKEQSSPLKSN